MKTALHDAAKENRLKICLEGLSLGDALGEMFFSNPWSIREAIQNNQLPPATWRYTDDTEMALAIAEVLRERGEINQELLAKRFADRFLQDPDRGYGKGARIFCEGINCGTPWRRASLLAFKSGSMGNGSAMRVAPVGAYFAETSLSGVVSEARKSAEVTHRHPEGVAGAVAVALAAAVAWQQRSSPINVAVKNIFETLQDLTPPGETQRGIQEASQLSFGTDPEQAAKVLGNGTLVTCPDTVPYVVWCACRHLNNFTEAIINTLAGGGDTDTNCAMVGGIVALHAGRESIPPLWLERGEPLNIF